MNVTRATGSALAGGFVLVLVLLYRDPPTGVDAATGGLASLVYFVVLPVGGVLAGAYAYADGPYSTLPLFLFGTYLGVFGLALALGSALAPTPAGLPLGVGLAVLALSLVTLVGSVVRVTSTVDVDLSGSSFDR